MLLFMFTGVVEELGILINKVELTDTVILTINGSNITSHTSLGESIAVNGICLSIIDMFKKYYFITEVTKETINRSNIGRISVGSKLNLERAICKNQRLNGHLVQGHVDGFGILVSRTYFKGWEVIRISLSNVLSRYVVQKGSVSLNGVSLTISSISNNWFEVSLIPTTLKLTNLGHIQLGTNINIEVDIFAKYIEKILFNLD